jgi:lipopolysaccharide export system protein LptA
MACSCICSKIHAAMINPRLFPFKNLAIATLAVLLCAPAWAEKADKSKPMNAEADALRYDDVKQTSVFSGNVVITKGSIIIRGAQVAVRQDAEGFQYGTVTSGGGKRAFFRQKRDGGDEWIEGEADTIYYDGKADNITFTKGAVLRRLRGAAVSDETSGNQISYDNLTDVFSVVGGVANASPANPTGRVRAIISPKGATAAAAPLVPAAPATLRPSTSIGADAK